MVKIYFYEKTGSLLKYYVIFKRPTIDISVICRPLSKIIFTSRKSIALVPKNRKTGLRHRYNRNAIVDFQPVETGYILKKSEHNVFLRILPNSPSRTDYFWYPVFVSTLLLVQTSMDRTSPLNPKIVHLEKKY